MTIICVYGGCEAQLSTDDHWLLNMKAPSFQRKFTDGAGWAFNTDDGGEARYYWCPEHSYACEECEMLVPISEVSNDLCRACAKKWATDNAQGAIADIKTITTMLCEAGEASSTLAHRVVTEMLHSCDNSPTPRCVECGGFGCQDEFETTDEEPRCLWCFADSEAPLKEAA